MSQGLCTTTKLLQGALLLAGLAALILGVEQVFGGHREALWLEVRALQRGEFYRLVSAHFIHLSAHHAVMNTLGLGLVGCALAPVLEARWLALALGASLAAISLGLWALQPAGLSYVGFSGILHGFFACGALMLLARQITGLGAAVLVLLAAKLGYEALWGPVPGADRGLGGEISTLSHALGGLGGALVAPPVPGRRWIKPGLITLAIGATVAAAVGG